MAQEWFYTLNGRQMPAPVSAAWLKQLADAGHLKPNDLVWRPGLPNWVPAASLKGLFPPPPPAPAPPPPRPNRAGVGGRVRAAAGALVRHLRRALAWDLGAMPVTEAEREALAGRGLGADTAQRYLAWRRSLLLVVFLPLCLGAALYTLGQDYGGMTAFGWVVTVPDVLAPYVLPASALAAALLWTRPRLSRRVLRIGWGVGFLVPILLALFPLDWRLRPDAVRPLAGVVYYFALMPTVLSLIPGLLRACIRVKSLLPGSILPGWFVVAGAPLYVLLLLVIFIAVNQVAGNLLLLWGVALLLTAPLVYAARAPLFVRPLADGADRRALARVQWAFFGCAAAGAALVCAYLMTREVFGRRLVGFDEATSWFRPWRIVQFFVEYLGRSLFITAVAADLLLGATLSLWRHEQRFAKTPAAAEHERRMEELGGALEDRG